MINLVYQIRQKYSSSLYNLLIYIYVDIIIIENNTFIYLPIRHFSLGGIYVSN